MSYFHSEDSNVPNITKSVSTLLLLLPVGVNDPVKRLSQKIIMLGCTHFTPGISLLQEKSYPKPHIVKGLCFISDHYNICGFKRGDCCMCRDHFFVNHSEAK